MNVFRLLLLLLLVHCFTAYSQAYDEYVDASFKCIEKDDWPAAEESLKQAMRLEPANPRNLLLLSNLGTVQRRAGKREDALLSYTSALSRNPKNTTLLSNRASLYVEMGETDKAIADYSSLLVADEKNEDAWYQRGLLYVSKKEYVSAETDFNKILEINPNTLNGRIGIATLCKLRGEYAEAEKIYIFLIDRIPEDPDLYLGRAELYLLMERNGRALSDINKALFLEEKKGIRNPYSYILRATVKIRQYEKKSAVEDIERAVDLGYDKVKAKELMDGIKN